MLPKANRLKTKKDFDLVYKKGKNCKSDYLYAKIVVKPKTDGESKPRIGFVISRKVEAKAVRRNHIKRILRSLSREVLSGLSGVDILIIVRRVPKENEYQVLAEDFKKVLKTGGVI